MNVALYNNDFERMRLTLSDQDFRRLFLQFRVEPISQADWDKLLDLYFPVGNFQIPIFLHSDWSGLERYYEFLAYFHRIADNFHKKQLHEYIRTRIEFLPTGNPETSPVWQYAYIDLNMKRDQDMQVKVFQRPKGLSHYPGTIIPYSDVSLHHKLALEQCFTKSKTVIPDWKNYNSNEVVRPQSRLIKVKIVPPEKPIVIFKYIEKNLHYTWRKDISVCNECNLAHPLQLPGVLLSLHNSSDFEQILIWYYMLLPFAKKEGFPILIDKLEREKWVDKSFLLNGKNNLGNLIQKYCNADSRVLAFAKEVYPGPISYGFLGGEILDYIKGKVASQFNLKNSISLVQWCQKVTGIQNRDLLEYYIGIALIPCILCQGLLLKRHTTKLEWKLSSDSEILGDYLSTISPGILKQLKEKN